MVTFKPGVVKSPPDYRDWQLARIMKYEAILPPNFMVDPGPTVDQKDRGTCGGFAAGYGTGFLEELENGTYLPMSPLAIYLKTRDLDAAIIAPGEDGVTMRSLVETLRHYGSPLETSFPYRTDFSNSERPPESIKEEAYKHRILSYARCDTVEDMKQALFQGKPVLVGLMLMSNMYDAINGIVPFENDKAYSWVGGHAMLFAGWNNEGPEELIGFKNSYGLNNRYVDKNGMTWFPRRYVELVLDIGMPMLLDAFALIDFIPEPELIKPKIYTVDEAKVNVIKDGKELKFKYAEPFIAKEIGRTFIGLRDLGEIFNCEVDYDDKTNTVILTSMTPIQSIIMALKRMLSNK